MLLIGRKCSHLHAVCTNLQRYPGTKSFPVFHKRFLNIPLKSSPESPPMSSPLLIKPILLQSLVFMINKVWCWPHYNCHTELFPDTCCCECQPLSHRIALACLCRMCWRTAMLGDMCFKFLTRPGQLVTFHNQANLSAKNWLY